jgi:hypothetical protein
MRSYEACPSKIARSKLDHSICCAPCYIELLNDGMHLAELLREAADQQKASRQPSGILFISLFHSRTLA